MMNSNILLLLFIAFSLFLNPTSPQSDDKEQKHTYIIRMDLSAKPKPFQDHHSWFMSMLADPSHHIYTYTSSIHGFAARLTSSELELLKSVSGYVSSSKDRRLQLHTTHTPAFLGLDDGYGTSTKLEGSNQGEDVIIGLIDTGIWPESESFRDEGMTKVPSRWKGKCVTATQFNSSLCNKKLIGAYFFNKGLIADDPDVKNLTVNTPRDTEGHGTHTASTAAGSPVKSASYFGYAPGTARGIAPRARVSVYKAAWKYGIAESDVIAAVDQAIRDGVDVLSISLGFYSDDAFFEYDAIASATFTAVERGIFVAASAGNAGSVYNTVINAAPWLTTVGAGTVDRKFGGVLTLGNGEKIQFASLYPGNFSSNEKDIVFLDGCTSIEEMKTYRKSIVVCKDNLSVDTQVKNAQVAKLRGVVFITDIYISEYYTRDSIPSAYIGSESGKRVIDYVAKSRKDVRNPRGKLTFRDTKIGTKPEPRVDDYSGKGPFPSCPSLLKPDIIAPGTLILAAWSPITPVAKIGQGTELFSNFNLMSGTSMSTPHVAGLAALIKNVHPDWSPAAIRSAMMTTASTLDNKGEPIKDILKHNAKADPFAMGSGHIVPIKAMDPGLVYDVTTSDYVSLLCAMNFTSKEIQLITRSSGHKCETTNKNSSGLLDLNYPSFLAYFLGNDTSSKSRVVREFRRSVTNVGDGVGAATYSAKIDGMMEGVVVKVVPDKLVFKKKGEKLSFKVSVEGPEAMNGIETVAYGSLSWVHDGGKYVVRSPIVATNIEPEPPFG
ncbi:Subtilisin-like protease SBT1.9 [Linum grandiflorum]